MASRIRENQAYLARLERALGTAQDELTTLGDVLGDTPRANLTAAIAYFTSRCESVKATIAREQAAAVTENA